MQGLNASELFADPDIAAGKFQQRIGTRNSGKNTFTVDIPEFLQRKVRGNDRRFPCKRAFVQYLEQP
jgi:hypothetical protein